MRIPEKMRLLREMQKKQDLLSIKGGKSFEDLEIWKTPKKVTEYAGNRKRIHLIHWYAKNRSSLELTDVEKFHFTMLYLSDFDCKFDEIYFTVAIDDMDADPLKEFISDKINELTKKVLEENLSVRELEALASGEEIERKNKIVKKPKSNEYTSLEKELTEYYGTKVKIANKKLIISFENNQDLNRILEMINYNK